MAGVAPGATYGYRVSGLHDPAHGLCHDPAKLLIDPYAGAVDGDVIWSEELLQPGVDSAPFMPRSVVVSDVFDWAGDRPPRTPWADTVIYEAHVKGLTMSHPSVPSALRGTYGGLTQPAVIEHLRALGITAVELLPVQHFVSERRLVGLGLVNYWGYNSLAWAAPHGGYAATGTRGQQVTEFKEMVRALHAAGIEVILDVVYNHTAEGGSDGPSLSWRGLDNRAYYRLDPADAQRTIDFTGCGNSLNVDHPAALRLVLDSLRHWVNDYHIDGFRFDLATTLGRDGGEFDPGAAFFDAIYADPVLAGVKLIAEPWDVGPDGYQLGRFPTGWSEWNDHFRDEVRAFWQGGGAVAGLAGSLAGSADRFARPGRLGEATVNFVACHDGFTLADLVSYDHKHNEANGEDNHDGTNDNRSWNCGVEGPSQDPAVRNLRARQQRNLLACVALSRGVPMIGAGDELGRTQSGNNNAYCLDDSRSWIDWDDLDSSLRVFTGRLFALRRRFAVLRSLRWATGQPQPPHDAVDMCWFDPRGRPMTDGDWADGRRRSVAFMLDGRCLVAGIDYPVPPSVYVILNGERTGLLARLPDELGAGAWQKVLDTASPVPQDHQRRLVTGDRFRVEALSVLVLANMSF